MATIDRESPLPLYYQLKQILLTQIESGEWQPGDLISSEQELQDSYGVSRTTVRQTLADLVNEGHLVRQQGRGTFVADPRRKLAHNPAHTQGITSYMQQQGIKPGWDILSMDWEAATEHQAAQLKVSPGEDVYTIRRLRLADNEAIGHHTAIISRATYALLDADSLTESLTDGESLRYLQAVPAMQGSMAHRTIEALPAESGDARLLDVQVGAPILQIEREVVAIDGTVIEYLQARYRGDRFKYQVTF